VKLDKPMARFGLTTC